MTVLRHRSPIKHRSCSIVEQPCLLFCSRLGPQFASPWNYRQCHIPGQVRGGTRCIQTTSPQSCHCFGFVRFQQEPKHKFKTWSHPEETSILVGRLLVVALSFVNPAVAQHTNTIPRQHINFPESLQHRLLTTCKTQFQDAAVSKHQSRRRRRSPSRH